ncbi:unnamed protein product [Didymodactylos carnosus]|uniref:Uncharacterized protein n=1 Tax=Didymodactylos carnosus TaxID=1234261 RepID=A0A814C2A3_9BILA|nr:unnamed protein product [Didymodactylos carnosus]CAF0935844.1 unnamed protein product [Didymodactylos carnosus]CAF3622236.1 unnamed protein product [Didymodactylos carnosus]CAF3713099.1 unnamed protein product [Didymodactylos carnosus]
MLNLQKQQKVQPVYAEMRRSISQGALVNLRDPTGGKAALASTPLGERAMLAPVREDIPASPSLNRKAVLSRVNRTPTLKNGEEIATQKDFREEVVIYNDLLQIMYVNQLFDELTEENDRLLMRYIGQLQMTAYRISNEMMNMNAASKKQRVDQSTDEIILVLGQTLLKMKKIFADNLLIQKAVDHALSSKINYLSIHNVASNDACDKENLKQTIDQLSDLINVIDQQAPIEEELDIQKNLIETLNHGACVYQHAIKDIQHVPSMAETKILNLCTKLVTLFTEKSKT